MKSSRRMFILQSAGVATALGLSRAALADTPALAESDPTAQALGYKSDATGDASGPCPIYAGKAVSAKGWCSSYAKKA
jgi:hypothetical protein